MVSWKKPLVFARAERDCISFTKCVSVKYRFILSGMFSHGAKAKTNSTHKGKWTDTWDEGQAASTSEISLIIAVVSALHALCEGPSSHHLLKRFLVCSMQILISILCMLFWGLLQISYPLSLSCTCWMPHQALQKKKANPLYVLRTY